MENHGKPWKKNPGIEKSWESHRIFIFYKLLPHFILENVLIAVFSGVLHAPEYSPQRV